MLLGDQREPSLFNERDDGKSVTETGRLVSQILCDCKRHACHFMSSLLLLLHHRTYFIPILVVHYYMSWTQLMSVLHGRIRQSLQNGMKACSEMRVIPWFIPWFPWLQSSMPVSSKSKNRREVLFFLQHLTSWSLNLLNCPSLDKEVIRQTRRDTYLLSSPLRDWMGQALQRLINTLSWHNFSDSFCWS